MFIYVGFRRKSYRAQPPGFPDAISLHSLWGRIRWQRNCINVVPVKILKTKGFVPSVISYNYSSLALDNSQSISVTENHMGKGVSKRFCVHLIDHIRCWSTRFCLEWHCRWTHCQCLCELEKILVGVLHQSSLHSPPGCSVALSYVNDGQKARAGWESVTELLLWQMAKLLFYPEGEVESWAERQQNSYSV